MKNKWTAEITNDSERDFELYIELLENEEFRGKIYRNQHGELTLAFYQSETAFELPLGWLLGIAAEAERDLPRQ